MSRIIKLETENVKRLQAVEITPTGDIVVLGGRNEQGKQQPVSEPVLTPSGWVPIGDLRAGDFVIGSSGLPVLVKAVIPQTERKVFMVRMSDGTSTRCGPDHLWTVGTFSGKDNRWAEFTLPLSDICKAGLMRAKASQSRRYAVPCVKPVAYSDSGMNLPVVPYTLGAIIGDGHIEPTGYVSFTSADQWIIDQLKVRSAWTAQRNGVITLGTGCWSRPLVHLGLAGKLSYEKFIPKIYLAASIDDRMALLAGLMDTDGTPSSPTAEYCTTSAALASDVAELARGLGYIASVRSQFKKYRYKGELKSGREAYVIRLRGEDSPFRLARKSDGWGGGRYAAKRFIDSVERTDDEDSVCIVVDASDGLYVTKDFIVTHNSSVIDSIEYALGGDPEAKMPVRRGEDKARVVVDLGDLIIKRTFTAAGGTSLTVMDADGKKQSSPQAILDRLVGRLTFDPLEFARQKPPQQAETLRSLVGLDFTAKDKERSEVFSQRTEVNRAVKALEARIAGLPKHEAPAEEVGTKPIIDEQQKAIDQNAANVTVRNQATQAGMADSAAADKVKATEASIADMEKEIARIKVELNHRLQLLVAHKTDKERTAANLNALKQRVAELKDTPLDGFAKRLAETEEVNVKVRANKAREELVAQFKAKQKESEDLTDRIEKIDSAKRKAITEAKYPVAGLLFDPAGGIVLDGIPFEQCSSAVKLKVSVAVGLALNPKLKVLLIRDGSLLDDDSMATLAAMAKEADAQVWLERVGVDAHTSVVIEDGLVRIPTVIPSDKVNNPPKEQSLL